MNTAHRKWLRGASTSEFLPILAFVVIAAIVGFTALGQQQKEQGGRIAQELAGTAQENHQTGSQSEQPTSQTVAEYVTDVAQGFVEGVTDNLAATWEMVTNPGETIEQIEAFAQQLINNPEETLAALAQEFGDQIKEIAGGNGKALGLFMAEYANPNRLATIMAKLRRFNPDLKSGIDPCMLASFTVGTEVLTPDGLKPIESLTEGDRVISRDDQTFATTESRITALRQRVAPSYITLTLHNEQIQTTPEHPFWTQNKGWQTADKLVYAQALATRDADRLIWALDPVNEPVTVYNFTVEPDHTYFVGKNHLWVHNANKDCGDRPSAGSDEASGEGGEKGLTGVPGRVQSRINLESSGWNHVVDRHFDSSKNASQFIISKKELRSLLQSDDIVGTPVTRTLKSADGIRYVRDVNIGWDIGLDKFSNMEPTSTMSILTDEFGNLVTVTPGIIK